MERALYIEKFRNLGIKESQKLILNRSLEKGKMGNLVILIGENNSGKSNVLDALEEFGKGSMQERDRTLLDYSTESQLPKLSITNKISDSEFYTYGFDYNKNVTAKHTVAESQSNTPPCKVSEKVIANFLTAINSYENYYGSFYNNEINNLTARLKALKDPVDFKIAEPILNALFENLNCSISRRHGSSYRQRLINYAPSNSIMSYYASTFQDSDDKTVKLKKEYSDRFGVALIPTIYRYTEKQIQTRDLSDDGNSDFIKTVLRAINVKPEEVDNAYSTFKSTRNRGILTTEERKLNKKLEKVAVRFNQIYFRSAKNDEANYSFRFNLESSRIFISLFRGENDINLDYQSTGFKWFFNLYFTLICNNNLKPGNIIIMDEPATNLHIGGQMELRKFLKEFAVANDITVFIATHSPFLIDLDYLDELRVITMKDGISYIYNDFTTVNDDDPDTLKPIKLSLTVNNHMLLDPDKKVIFVEGITDYNYLTAFKKLYQKDDVVFLPINGLGNLNEDLDKRHKDIVKALQEIRRHNPILLVDGDAAGKNMKEFCEKNKTELKVFSLNEVDDSFKTIESLFSANDLTNLKIKDAAGNIEKRSSSSAVLKTFCSAESFSKATMNNFKKLFNFIDSI